MSSLLLKFRGPLQSWGTESRFRYREAGQEPSKSAVIGLLAAAEGRRRTDSVEDLVDLQFGVRTDQPGTLTRDYQTAENWFDAKLSTSLSQRMYIADAVYLVALSGQEGLIQSLAEALKSPAFPLYLGRRSCPVTFDFFLGMGDGDVESVLRQAPWHASTWYRRQQGKFVDLPLVRDAKPGEVGDRRRDIPVSFDPAQRLYRYRDVVHLPPVRVDNPDGRSIDDPFLEAVLS